MGTDMDRDRLLPRGVPLIGAPPPHEFGGGLKRPPSYVELAAAGLLAPLSNPWAHFDRPLRAGERVIAGWLQERGIVVRSVAVDVFRTPDAVIDDVRMTVEFKTVGRGAADAAGAIYQRIRHARAQSPHVVVDVRGTAATRNDANRAVMRALRNGGRDLREVAVVGDGFVLSWP